MTSTDPWRKTCRSINILTLCHYGMCIDQSHAFYYSSTAHHICPRWGSNKSLCHASFSRYSSAQYMYQQVVQIYIHVLQYLSCYYNNKICPSTIWLMQSSFFKSRKYLVFQFWDLHICNIALFLPCSRKQIVIPVIKLFLLLEKKSAMQCCIHVNDDAKQARG